MCWSRQSEDTRDQRHGEVDTGYVESQFFFFGRGEGGNLAEQNLGGSRGKPPENPGNFQGK